MSHDFPGGIVVRNPPANAEDTRDVGLILWSGRAPGEEKGKLLQYSCLGNPMNRGACRGRGAGREGVGTVHSVAKSWT